MADRFLSFRAPMVLGLLEDRKTQTRRLLKPQPHSPQSAVWHDREAGKWMSVEPSPVTGGTRQMDPWRKTPISIGDRVWVKEAMAIVPRTAYRMSEGVQQTLKPDDNHDAAVYAAGWERSKPGRWRAATFCPRWASRITLIIEDVKIEPLQDISEADAIAEGIERKKICGVGDVWTHYGNPNAPVGWHNPVQSYETLWDSINGKSAGAWKDNPWVVAYTFRVIKANIDA